MNEEQAMQGQIADQMLNEKIDLDKALDDLLEKNNVQVDENSDEPVVFESVSYTHLTLPTNA